MNRKARRLRHKRQRRRKVTLTTEQRVSAELAAMEALDRAQRDEEMWQAQLLECMSGEHCYQPHYSPLNLDRWEIAELRRRNLRVITRYERRVTTCDHAISEDDDARTRRMFWAMRLLPPGAYEARLLTRYAEGGSEWVAAKSRP